MNELVGKVNGQEGRASALGSQLTIVIATRNRRDALLQTLPHLTALEAAYPIMVIDNASDDGTANTVAAAFPDVTVIALDRNIGAAARTVGVERARTPYVAFADDDSWWERGALADAIWLFQHHPRLALVAARVLIEPGGRIDPTCVGMAQSPISPPPGAPGVPVLGFLACGAIVHREAFLAAGGFHPRFMVGGEEGLLAVDLVRSGWWVSYVDELVCHHQPSLKRDQAGRRRTEVRNRLWELWLRRPLRDVLSETSKVVRLSWRDAACRNGVLTALRGLPWIARERSSVPAWLNRQLRLLERR